MQEWAQLVKNLSLKAMGESGIGIKTEPRTSETAGEKSQAETEETKAALSFKGTITEGRGT